MEPISNAGNVQLAINGLSKKTGCRAGKRNLHHHIRTSNQQRLPSKLTPILRSNHNKRGALLPCMLYTNCRSLNTWKLSELEVSTKLHSPDLICLTETWVDTTTQQTISIDNYQNYFSHRLVRRGGGVGILVHHNINPVLLSSHTAPTVSTIWLMIDITACSPIIVGCIYHSPNGSNELSLDRITTTILQLTRQHTSAEFILTGDFNNLPIADTCEQLGLRDLVNFATRLNNQLDSILTDIADYEEVKKLSPLALNDHCCILVDGQRTAHALRIHQSKAEGCNPTTKGRSDMCPHQRRLVINS